MCNLPVGNEGKSLRNIFLGSKEIVLMNFIRYTRCDNKISEMALPHQRFREGRGGVKNDGRSGHLITHRTCKEKTITVF